MPIHARQSGFGHYAAFYSKSCFNRLLKQPAKAHVMDHEYYQLMTLPSHHIRTLAVAHRHCPSLCKQAFLSYMRTSADCPLPGFQNRQHRSPGLSSRRCASIHQCHPSMLHSSQVLLATNFNNFPSRAITVEFWMFRQVSGVDRHGWLVRPARVQGIHCS